MMTDPIADCLARLRNNMMIKRPAVQLRASKLAQRILEILRKEGFVGDFGVEEEDGKRSFRVELKYDEEGKPVIEGMQRVSKPGLRVYKGAGELPHVRNGMGIAIVSTSKGVMTCREARKVGVGGEILCYVW